MTGRFEVTLALTRGTHVPPLAIVSSFRVPKLRLGTHILEALLRAQAKQGARAGELVTPRQADAVPLWGCVGDCSAIRASGGGQAFSLADVLIGGAISDLGHPVAGYAPINSYRTFRCLG